MKNLVQVKERMHANNSSIFSAEKLLIFAPLFGVWAGTPFLRPRQEL
jgi:hypothetical protein